MDYTVDGMFGIRDEVAIVTGAAGGIGREIAFGMCSLGAKVALVDISGKLEETCRELKAEGFDVIPVKTDITDKVSVQAMAEAVMAHYGKIDILVNCAGIAYVAPAADFDADKWQQVMDVNVKGTMLTCQAVGKFMLQRKKGRIVNFSSVRGHQGKANYLAYAPSKGAVNLLTKTLAVEWAQEGINVNAVAPIFTLTDMNRNILDDKKTYDWVIGRLPKGRLCETYLLVGPTVFLCSPCSEFVNGHILYVDGGWTAG